jgi:hypothetical protein
MEKQLTTLQKIAGVLKNWILPIIASAAVAYGTYVTMDLKLNNAILGLSSLQTTVYANEKDSDDEHTELLQRVSSMEAQIKYIYEWVKESRAK